MAYSKQNFQNGQILNAANLEKMENGIIAGQGAENLLDNSNFRDPVNSQGKNTYSDASNEYTIDRWKTQSGTNISIENGYINIIGQGELYQIIQNPKDGIYTFAARIRINSVGQFTPIMGVNNGGNTGRQINLDADIGEWKTYILQYDLSSMTAETIKFLLSPRGGDTTASISVEWAAMYKGAYATNTLPAYVPKGKHVEMLNCGVSLQPHNLLDNSDFRNPVNSRGITSTEASGYHIDRWKKENESGKVTVGNGYLSMTGTGAYWFLTQYIEPKKIKSGAVYTIALADTSGSVSVCSTVMSTNMAKFTARHTFTSGAVVITNVEYASDKYSIYFTSNSSKETRFAWAVLYEGSYTVDTIPPYVPKGKHVEMLNCGVPLAPYNLLDNSDFTNPVNQRGQTSYTGAGDTIDRWKAGVSDCSMYVNAGKSIAFNTKTEGVNAYWRQYLPHSLSQLGGKTFTLAIKDAWGKTHCASGVYPTSAPSDTKSVIWINMYENVSIVLYCATDGTAFVQLTTKKSVPISWVALYEGSYTAGTLPPYIPKGKHIEMLNCGVPLALHNLLDNSDFRNPVNQLGRSGTYEGVSNYTTIVIDRWKTWSTGCTYTLSSAGLQIANLNASSPAGPWEVLPNPERMKGKTYTLAVGYNGGNVACGNVAVPTGTLTEDKYLSAVSTSGTRPGLRFVIASTYSSIDFQILISAGQTVTIEWAALYEGSYDASTLPFYVLKGKHVEMLNCGVSLAPHNILDNSNFANPITQAGMNGMHGSTKYVCDRWISWDANATFGSGYITPGSPIDQHLSKTVIDINKTYTAAICLSDGTIKTDYGTFSNGFGSYALGIYCMKQTDSSGYVTVRLNTGNNIRWAALYEGSYTAETLPAYQPKGYAAELAECQRYYWQYQQNNNMAVGNGYMNTTDTANITFEFPTKMRVAPTISIEDISTLRVMCVDGLKGVTAYSVVKSTYNQIMVGFTLNSASTAFTPCTLRSNSGVKIEFSADL